MDQLTTDALAAVNASTAPCWLCGDPCRRVPAGDEWAWAGPDGKTTGLDGDLCRDLTGPVPGVTPDPYEALAWLREHNVRQYVALKVRLAEGGTFHQHTVLAADERGPAIEALPWHCAWPMRLTPSGWACRQCAHRQDEARTLEPAP